MKNQFNRREFLKQSAAIGAAAAVSSLPIPSVLFGKSLNTGNTISVVNGTNYFQNTFKALEMLGGINKFVQKGKTVGLLINSPFKRRAACTNPDVSLAVLKMCFEAGAKDVYSIEGATSDYWQRSSQFNSFTSELNRLQHNFKKIKVQISKGKSLKEAEISETLLKCDVFINIPIVKHHEGTLFTANLKNMMGACTSSTNKFFHQGSGKGGLLKYFRYYDDIDFLSQCIADVNLVRKPDLCIVDATEFLTTNGPAGPGESKKAQKIVAGTNIVSVDAYCSTLFGLQPQDVLMIRYAYEHNLGEIDLSKITVKEV